ncbi:hypothetical protein [Streptomyces sp. NPDC059814]|uniref:hypothetical protein n=1 Tax=Streptomyces sp. NPDC059814 TaxID=3346959 RepID=UPI003654593A
MNVPTNLVPTALSAVVTAATSLNRPALLVLLVVLLVVYLLVHLVRHTTSALPDVLRHRLHTKAVEKADPADLPALFRAFRPNEAEPDPPDNDGP